jgi:hypothetical protein
MSVDYMATDAYRATHNPMTAHSPERTGDCNTCSWNKNMMSKIKGKRIPGSFGKCTHPDGPCDNPVPRAGIRDLSNPTKPTYSTWRKKER